MALQPSDSDAIATVAKAVSSNIPDSFGEVMAWITGLFAVITGGRKVFKGVKGDVYEVSRIESERAQLERKDKEINTKDYKIAALELKIKRLRDVELEGAPDIAIIGVWIKQLETRHCPCIEQGFCCATHPTLNLIEAYTRVSNRRIEKSHIFANNEMPPDEKAKD